MTTYSELVETVITPGMSAKWVPRKPSRWAPIRLSEPTGNGWPATAPQQRVKTMTKPTYEELEALNEKLAQRLVGMSDRPQDSMVGTAARAWEEGVTAGMLYAHGLSPNENPARLENPYLLKILEAHRLKDLIQENPHD